MNESWIQKDSLFNGCCADGCLNCCCLVGLQKSRTRRNLVSCVPILMVSARHIFRRKLNLHWRAWPKGLQCLHLELTLVNGARWTVSTWLMINSTQSMCQGYFLIETVNLWTIFQCLYLTSSCLIHTDEYLLNWKIGVVNSDWKTKISRFYYKSSSRYVLFCTISSGNFIKWQIVETVYRG